MNIVRRQAIVLHKDQFNAQKMVLLDKDEGKIVCFVRDRELSPGMYIEYVPVVGRRFLVITDINIVYVPFALARHDIVFMHAILELCHHFILEGMQANDIFHLLEYLYIHASWWHESRAKRLYMSKLFVLFGMHPDARHMTIDYWHMLRSMAIDRIVDVRLELDIEKEIVAWLHSCIMAHPAAHTFKIALFLDED